MCVIKSEIVIIYVLALIVPQGDTIRPRIKENEVKEKRDYRPTKWVANSAMDVWYGNKSMIDIIAREFSDIMYKYTSRSVRATQLDTNLNRTATTGESGALEPTTADVPSIEINFLNSNNKTVQSVKILPGGLLQRLNTTQL